MTRCSSQNEEQVRIPVTLGKIGTYLLEAEGALLAEVTLHMLGDLFLAGGFAELYVTDGALKLSQAFQAGRPFVTLVGKPHARKE